MRYLFGFILLSRLMNAADACASIPPQQIVRLLGMAKNTSVNSVKVTPPALNSKACSYAGPDNIGTVIWTNFNTPADANQCVKTFRASLEKQNIKTTSENFGNNTGFSFVSGMIGVNKSTVIRVNVVYNGGEKKTINIDLTRDLLSLALESN